MFLGVPSPMKSVEAPVVGVYRENLDLAEPRLKGRTDEAPSDALRGVVLEQLPHVPLGGSGACGRSDEIDAPLSASARYTQVVHPSTRTTLGGPTPATIETEPALHRIAVSQIRLDGEGRRYYRKRLLAADSNTEALRCPRRRLARVVFQILKTNAQPATGLHPAAADIGETMTYTPGRVMLTGAAGRIGRAITPLLPANWDVQRTDLTASDCISAFDIGNADACRAAFVGADAVVHLAAVPDPEASWEQLLPANVVGVYEVAQAAVSCRVRRLVLASSLHAVSGMPDQTQARVGDRPRPGNLYGATKAWAEAIGAWVAATTPTSVVALRIGYFAPQPPDAETVPAREISAWLSPRDAAEVVRAAVEAVGFNFVIANGISANRYCRADLKETMHQLGYRPIDDAWRSP